MLRYMRLWNRAHPYFIPAIVVSLVVIGIVAVGLIGDSGSNTAYAQSGGAECDQDPNCIKYDSPGKRSGCVPATGAIRFVIKNGDGEFSIEFPASGGTGMTGGYVVAYSGTQVCWTANPTTKDVSNVQVWQILGTPTPTPPPPSPTPEGTPTGTPSPTPDGENKCQGGGEDWDCSSVEVIGQCVNSDGVLSSSFIVTNTGDAGGGDMDGPTEFRLYANGELVETGSLQIPGGGTASINYEGERDDVIRLEVDQRPGHPGNSHPNAEVTLDCAPAPLIVIEGPVTQININVIVIFDIEIELDPNDPILLDLQIGDVIRIEGSTEFDGNVIVIVVVNVFIIQYENIVFVNLPAGCKLTGRGNGQIRCKGSSRRTTD